eukprot:3861117-Lingulodinium_polyedra.AAC.1
MEIEAARFPKEEEQQPSGFQTSDILKIEEGLRRLRLKTELGEEEEEEAEEGEPGPSGHEGRVLSV